MFKRVNYKLQNNTFLVVITPPNRVLLSGYYKIMLITSKNFKWHDDQTLTWDIKDIKLKFQQELSNTLPNHNS